MVKFASRLMLVAAIAWTGYVATEAGWRHYATQDAVDAVLREAATQYRIPLATESFTDTMRADVCDRVARGAGRDGLLVQASDVAVSARAGAISATVHYSYPVIRLGGKDILVVPLSVQRSTVADFKS